MVKVKEELEPSLKMTSAKAISELRKLERRNSFELQEQLQKQANRSGDRRGRRHPTARARVKSAATHAAPFAVSLSIKCIYDGSRGLLARWHSDASEPSTRLVLLLQCLAGLAILYILHILLDASSSKEKGFGGKQQRPHLRSSSSSRSLSNEQLAGLNERLTALVRSLFGGENVGEAERRLSSARDSHRLLSSICRVVGVQETQSRRFVDMSEKLREVELAVGG
mmetsp:Transcript_7668/g.18833  ORF Transcript_7668/g.18833 Transcript_7668/m.18833 type:complete len:225 (-) Transcript_7668:643-1317(-)